MRHNVLEEPVFRVRLTDGKLLSTTLPGVLAALATQDVAAFPGLQVHQTHAWHAFLVQLAAIAVERAGDKATTEEEWGRLLRSLSGGRDEPWCLVVEDLARPAFFQPPVPEGSLGKWKNLCRSPSEIDVLNTAKNHDVKIARVPAGATPEHWAFALVSLQTMQGFLGAGNYGIARMNGGFSSRPCFAFAESLSPSARFRRDLAVLLSKATEIEGQYGYDPDGVALLWLEPWDGTSSLTLSQCHPWFIEICRRVRLVEHDGGLAARTIPTKAARIAAKESKGNTGDPWTPTRDGASLTVPPAGITYELIQDVLFSGNYSPGAALEIRPDDPPELNFVASALVRGQGRTDGYHERTIPIPGKVRLRLTSKEGRASIGQRAKSRVDKVATVRLRVLKPALLALLQGGPEEIDWKDERASRWLDRFHDAVDGCFFEALWRDLDLPQAEADANWERDLLHLARAELFDAMDSVPLPSARAFRARAAAERVFEGARRNHLPTTIASRESTHEPA